MLSEQAALDSICYGHRSDMKIGSLVQRSMEEESEDDVLLIGEVQVK